MTTQDDAIALAGTLMVGMSSAEILAATGIEATPEQLRAAFGRAVIRAKQDQFIRIQTALYAMNKPENRAKNVDEEISRGTFLLRTFQA